MRCPLHERTAAHLVDRVCPTYPRNGSNLTAVNLPFVGIGLRFIADVQRLWQLDQSSQELVLQILGQQRSKPRPETKKPPFGGFSALLTAHPLQTAGCWFLWE